MSEHPLLIADCPRCGSKHVTFDILGYAESPKDYTTLVEAMSWCRHCFQSTLFLIRQTNFSNNLNGLKGHPINNAFSVVNAVLIIPTSEPCPEFVPEDIKGLFDEGTKCMAVQCYDASGTMFRKVLDAATRKLLPHQPENEDKSNPDYIAWKVRKDLKLRLDWLFEHGKLADGLRDLATCVREDGNDAAHDLSGIGKDEAADLRDFTVMILETLYTIPGQIVENKRRREARREGS